MFSLGRKHNGTHFICLDCDEVLSNNFIKKSKKILNSLKKGEKISMRWISTWKNPFLYRVDKKSIWSNMWKDFVVCDDKAQNYNCKSGFHEPRTICDNSKIKYLEIENGCVIHLQFVDWSSFKLKQIYYSIHDLIKSNENISRVNRKYYFSQINNFPKLKEIPKNWINHIDYNDYKKLSKLDNSFFWKKKILRLLEGYNLKLLKNLNIWNSIFMQNIFKKRTKINPRMSFFERVKLKLFYIKSTYQQFIKK